mgnify:CR=1 FL=1
MAPVRTFGVLAGVLPATGTLPGSEVGGVPRALEVARAFASEAL